MDKIKIKKIVHSFFVEITVILTILVALLAMAIAQFFTKLVMTIVSVFTDQLPSGLLVYYFWTYLVSLIVVGSIWIFIVLYAYRKVK